MERDASGMRPVYARYMPGICPYTSGMHPGCVVYTSCMRRVYVVYKAYLKVVYKAYLKCIRFILSTEPPFSLFGTQCMYSVRLQYDYSGVYNL